MRLPADRRGRAPRCVGVPPTFHPATGFSYQLAACDLDGTLLGPKKNISPANLEAVRRLQANGVRFVIASGRRHQNSIRYYREMGLEGLMVSCAGALIKDPGTNETLREVLIPADIADELVARGEENGSMVIYYHRDGLYVNRRDHWTALYESRVNEKADLYPGGLRALRGQAALKLVWYGEPAKLGPLRTKVEAGYRDRLSVVATDKENLEFLAPGANKADALAAVAAYYGVKREHILAFGDGENDAPMLRWARCGVAMDGGNDLAKQAARMVSPQGPPEESFARAVNELLQQSTDAA